MRSTFSIIFLLALTGMAAGTQAQSIFQVVPTPEGNLPVPGNNYLYAASASSPSVRPTAQAPTPNKKERRAGASRSAHC